MNEHPCQAWRFIHPDFSELGEDELASTGLRLSHKGAVGLVSGAEAVRQALLLLLTTIPGERVMRPDYGCDLYRLVFSPNDAATAGLAIHYVRRAVERFEPRVEVSRIDALPNTEQPERLDISLEYRLKGAREIYQLYFSLDLMEGENYAAAIT